MQCIYLLFNTLGYFHTFAFFSTFAYFNTFPYFNAFSYFNALSYFNAFSYSMHSPIQRILLFQCIVLFHRVLLFQCVPSPAWYLCFSPPPGIQRGFPSRPCCPVHPLADAGPSHHPAFPPIFPGVGTARPQPLPASACVATARPGGWCLIFWRMTHGEMPASSVKNFKQRLF